jgi:chaperonin GroES
MHDSWLTCLQFKTVSPVGDRVFVKVDQSEEKTTSGILLPSSAQKKPTQGEIVGAGSGQAVKVGQT